MKRKQGLTLCLTLVAPLGALRRLDFPLPAHSRLGWTEYLGAASLPAASAHSPNYRVAMGAQVRGEEEHRDPLGRYSVFLEFVMEICGL